MGSPPPPSEGGGGPPPPLQPPKLSNTPRGHTLAGASPRARRIALPRVGPQPSRPVGAGRHRVRVPFPPRELRYSQTFGGGSGLCRAVLWDRDFSFFSFAKDSPEVIGGKIRSLDGGGHSTDGGWRSTDGGWRLTDGSWRLTDGGWRLTDVTQPTAVGA